VSVFAIISAGYFKIVFGNLSEGKTPLKIDFVFECLEKKCSICKVFILKERTNISVLININH